MLHCLEQGGEVVGTVRNVQALEELKARLPAQAPVTLLIADLSRPGALVEALDNAQITPASLAIAILNAGVKYDGESVLSLASLRDTFQVNFFSAAELATWLCGPAAQETRAAHPVALVLVSSMGRWHGMHFVCGYNASKAALSIWGESLEMELRQSGKQRFTVTIVEPGIFESGMIRCTALTRLLSVSRQDVARRIVSAALAGERALRPPVWFALLTWAVRLAGRDFRYRLFTRAKTTVDRR
jgi:short-subunit dehydrogenase